MSSQSASYFVPIVPTPNPKGLLEFTAWDHIKTMAGMATNPIRTLSAYQFTLPVFQYSIFGTHFTVINDPDMIRHCFVKNAGNYTLEPIRQSILTPALRDGIIAVEGDTWKRARRVLAPIFTPAYTKSLGVMMKTAVDETLENALPTGKSLLVGDAMSALAYGVLSRTLFSGDIDADADAMMADVGDFFTLLGNVDPLDMLRVPNWVPRPTRLSGHKAVKRLRRRIANVVDKRLSDKTSGAALPDDFLTHLINAIDDDKTPLTPEEIEDHILTFIAAGHETTARGLAWVLYLLSNDAQARRRVEAEVDALNLNDPPSQWIAEMPFTIACFEESMRLYPPAPFLTRMAKNDDRFGLAFIPAGGYVFLNLYALHRHETLWDRPEQFDPDRFMSKRKASLKKFQYLPFGVGHRICIGGHFAMQEAMIILALALRKFRFDYVGDAPPEPVMRITLKPHNGMPMRVTHRHKS